MKVRGALASAAGTREHAPRAANAPLDPKTRVRPKIMQYKAKTVMLGLLALLVAPMPVSAQTTDGAQPESNPVEQATARTLVGYWTGDRLQSATPSALPTLSASEVRTKPHPGTTDGGTEADVPGAKSPRKLAD